MNCSICQKSFNSQNKKPLLFPCGHTYCFKCVYKMRKSKNVQCPEDLQKFDVSQEFPVQDEILNQQKQAKEDLIKAETLDIINERISRISGSFDYKFQIVTVGSIATGKTCILQKYFQNLFGPTTPTITVDFFTKSVNFKDNNIILTAHDTAGHESFKCMTQKYVRDKHCILLVYDISQQKTFEDLEEWHKWVNDLKRSDAFYVLVGSKSDLKEERQVSTQQGIEWAKAHNMPFFEVSALANKNIKELFDYCLLTCYKQFGEQERQKGEQFKVIYRKKKNKGCFDWFKKIFE